MKNGPTTPTTADTSGLPTASESQPISPVEASPSEIVKRPTPGALENTASADSTKSPTSSAHDDTAARGTTDAPPAAPPTESSSSSSGQSAAAQTPEQQKLRNWLENHPSVEQYKQELESWAKNTGQSDPQDAVNQHLNKYVDDQMAKIQTRDGWQQKLSEKLAAQQAPTSAPGGEAPSKGFFGLFKKAGESVATAAKDAANLGGKVASGLRANVDPRKAAAAMFKDEKFRSNVLQQTHNAVKSEIFGSANQQADIRAPRLFNRIAHRKANQQAASVLPQVSQVAQAAVSDAFNNKAPTPPSGNFRGMPSRIMNSNRQWVNNPSLSKASVYNQAYNDAVYRILQGH